MDKCPFCGAESKNPIRWACGTRISDSDHRVGPEYIRWWRCYETQLAHQTALLREAQNAINSLTGFRECIYDCSIVPTYQESEAAAAAVVIKIDEELRKIK